MIGKRSNGRGAPVHRIGNGAVGIVKRLVRVNDTRLPLPPLATILREEAGSPGCNTDKTRKHTRTKGRAMNGMNDRREGFEKKFVMDEDTRFKAMARRNKLLGLWAAEKLGKTGGEAEAYAKDVVRADFEEAGDEDVLRKVRIDFEAVDLPASEAEIRGVMDELMTTAVEQIKNS